MSLLADATIAVPEIAIDPAPARDIVGLYLNPPAKALVLSVDEKSQIQALDRTAADPAAAAGGAGAPDA